MLSPIVFGQRDLLPPLSPWLRGPCFCTLQFQTFQPKYFILNVIQLHASVIFAVLAVRLVGGSSNAGRVEVYYNGAWGTVCDDYSWDIKDARVVCRQLGFRYALNAYRNAHYGRGTGPILLSYVSCSGSESSLFLCRHSGVGNHYCGHNKDASVRCGNTGGENN